MTLTVGPDTRLYGIVDLGYVSAVQVASVTRQLLAGGVDILQLRAKKLSADDITRLAEVMLPLTQAASVPFIINDHPAVAAKVGADGVHVGQEDDAVARARDIIGPGRIVGKSTHSLYQAETAQAEAPDYIGFGPLYATGTKPDYIPIGLSDISEAHRRVNLPIFCIGGVNPARLDEILQAGARRIVIVSAFLQAPDITAEVRAVKARLQAIHL
jgi:thiamine-phosphate pyrophosphorylase